MKMRVWAGGAKKSVVHRKEMILVENSGGRDKD